MHYLLARKATPAGLSYVSAAAYRHPDGYAKLRRVEVATTDMEFNLSSVTGESLADELEASGRVAVYGIYCDTDSADLKPESDQTLGEIATMLNRRPDIMLYVDGHTDAEGENSYNQALSARRALNSHSIDRRLTPRATTHHSLQRCGYSTWFRTLYFRKKFASP